MSAQILVVDDEPDYCENVADVLGEMGYGIDVAHRGNEAIAQVRKRPYDLFLLDYKLPCMTGAELYKRLKQAGASTPAILVTAYASDETTQEAKAAGVGEIVEKPVDFGKLATVIERQIEKNGPRSSSSAMSDEVAVLLAEISNFCRQIEQFDAYGEFPADLRSCLERVKQLVAKMRNRSNGR